MRLLHTSDWHAGRQLAGQSLDEGLFAALDEMEEFVVKERVDAVLVSGDLFDSFRPPGRAQERVYEFFLRLYKEEVPAVLVAGNHDSFGHWGAVSKLLKLANIYVASRPSLDSVFTLPTRSGPLNVAGLAWPSERQLAPLVGSEKRGQDEHRQEWATKVETVLRILCDKLGTHGPRILVGHLFVSGTTPSGTERPLSITDIFAVPGEAIPKEFTYAALGHVHCYRKAAAPARTYYCGAPRVLDFGEGREKRGFAVVDVKGGFAEAEFVEISPKQPLRTVEVDFEALESALDEHRGCDGYLKFVVRAGEPVAALAERVRQQLANALIVQTLRTGVDRPLEAKSVETLLDPRETFQEYYRKSTGADQVPEGLLLAFNEIFDEVVHAHPAD